MLSEDAECGERVVLSRGDVCLREADVSLLHGTRWLNDNLVTFFFSHLQEQAPQDVLLVDGSVRGRRLLGPGSQACFAAHR